MNDFSDVILYIFEWLRDTYWSFHLFGQEWSLSFLFIYLIPVFGSLTIFIIKKIFELTE